MNVLGISCYYHDAAAALVLDGRVVAASEEERFTRRKHDASFPKNAAEDCLRQAGLTIDDVDVVCFYEKPLRKLERVLAVGRALPEAAEATAGQIARSLEHHLFLPRVLKDQLGYTGPVKYTDHHLAHAASAYYISGFSRAAVLTIDGVGEWCTTALYEAEGKRIKKLKEVRYPHSLGLFYSTMTAYLGFKVNNDEYKVMGLASYGEPRYVDDLRKLITFHDDGSLRLDLSYFDFVGGRERMYSDKLIELFGEPRVPESAIDQKVMDLASSTQALLEEGVLRLARAAHAETGHAHLCLAGGVALNCVANARLLAEGPFERVCVQPAAGDDGGALGAALYAYHRLSEGPVYKGRHSTLLGPRFDAEEIRAYLEGEDAIFTEMSEEEICAETAKLLDKSCIIGWYQGRMEYGPRALGNRTILANPCNPDMKDILNRRVKFREEFRPFAPAVLAEKASEWFEIDRESPFMLFAPPVRPGVGERLPSITHVDGTARVQTVSVEDNPRFHKLIAAVEARTGVPVVINTSFNVRGEPIVCTPADAYQCFLRTDIDFLVMDTFLVEKEA